MVKAPDARTSALEYDGAIPLVISSGNVDLTTASTAQDHFRVPFDYEVVSIDYSLLVAPGSAAATIFAGPTTDTDKFADDVSIATTDAVGSYSVTPAATTGSAGDVIVFGTNGNATSTGSAVMTLVIVPKRS